MIGNYLAYRLATAGPVGVGPTIKRDWEIVDGPYPKTFGDYIGQSKARAMILAAIASALTRQAPMDHTLIASGHPGIGKTTLARLTAYKLGVGFMELGGAVTDKDAARALKGMQDGDVLFLDEIHRLVHRGKSNAEWLLTLLQDGSIQTPTGSIQAPAITVIAATTDAQKLPSTILDRFMVKPILEPYSTPEATLIARTTAHRMGFGSDQLPMPTGEDWLRQVADASNNNPRLMGGLLTTIRDIAYSTELGNLDGNEGYDIQLALEWNDLTPDGLTRTAQDYMCALWSHGGTAGISTIKATLNEEQLGHTERLLIQKGYITVATRGRTLTDYGMERARGLVETAVAAHEAREEIGA